MTKIDICPFRAYQRSFRLFQGDFSKDIHQRSRLLCFTQNDHTGHAEFKICPFLKWTQKIKKKFECVVLIAILYVQMVDTQRKSTYGNSRKSAGNCHILP